MSLNCVRSNGFLFAMATAFFFLLLVPGKAQAACTATSATVSLATVSSFTIIDNQTSGSGSTGFKCSGSLLGLVSENWIQATIQGGSNDVGQTIRLKHSGKNDYIPYTLCKVVNCASGLNKGDVIEWNERTFLDILGLLTAPGGTLPIHVFASADGHIAPGVYTDSINIKWDWKLCTIGLWDLCSFSTGTLNSQINVSLVITSDCRIKADPIDFGSAAFVSNFDPVKGSIEIRCSKDQLYDVGLSNGANYSGSRRMARSGQFISYDIFYPANAAGTRWPTLANGGIPSVQATLNNLEHSGNVDQIFQFEARVLPGQTTPLPGRYTDTLVVTVQF